VTGLRVVIELWCFWGRWMQFLVNPITKFIKNCYSNDLPKDCKLHAWLRTNVTNAAMIVLPSRVVLWTRPSKIEQKINPQRFSIFIIIIIEFKNNDNMHTKSIQAKSKIKQQTK